MPAQRICRLGATLLVAVLALLPATAIPAADRPPDLPPPHGTGLPVETLHDAPAPVGVAAKGPGDAGGEPPVGVNRNTWQENFAYPDGTLPDTLRVYTSTVDGLSELDVQDGKLEGRIDTPTLGNPSNIFWQPEGIAFRRDSMLTLEYEGVEMPGERYGNWSHRIFLLPIGTPLEQQGGVLPMIRISTQLRHGASIWGWDRYGNVTVIADPMYDMVEGLHTYRLEINHVGGDPSLGSLRFYRDGVLEATGEHATTYLAEAYLVKFFMDGNDPYGATHTWDDVTITTQWPGSYLWQTETVDSSGNVGRCASLDLDASGQPHVSYCRYTAGLQDGLLYARQEDAGWLTVTVDPGDRNGVASSMGLDSAGVPHISYRGGLSGSLKYATSVETGGNCGPGGTTWQCSVLEADTGGAFVSLAVGQDDLPRISYSVNRLDGVGVRYARLDGGLWYTESVDVRIGEDPGMYHSLALDAEDFPHISYHHAYPAYMLKYAHYVGNGGNCGTGGTWQCDPIDYVYGERVGLYTSLALDAQGWPHISYYDNTNGDLKYAHYVETGGNCAAWDSWLCETVDSDGNVGLYTSLALEILPGGQARPHISYYDQDNQRLKYAWYDGSQWRITVLDSDGDVGRYSSLALDSFGRPHVTYYDATNADLKYAHETLCAPVYNANFNWLPPLPEAGEEVAFSAVASSTQPISYRWHLGDGAIGAGPTVTHTYAAGGVYTVVLTATTCGTVTAVATHPVTICQAVEDVTIAGPAEIGMGETGLYTVSHLPFTATAPVASVWSNGTWGPVAAYSWTVPGVYTISVTTTNPCGQVRDDMAVTVACRPVTGVEIAGAGALFVGQEGAYMATAQPITASPPLDYRWDNGQTGPAATYSWTLPGTYTLRVTAANYCGQAPDADAVSVSPWSRADPPAYPPMRARFAADYDRDRSRVVLFGGVTGVQPGGCSGETWTYDGSHWAQVATTGPSPRSEAGMAYADHLGQFVLFGGYPGCAPPHVGAETWLYDPAGQTWTQLSPDHAPPPRGGHQLAYDAARQRLILFGGWDGQAYLDDTWAFDGTDWTLLSPTHRPPARADAAMAYDPVQDRVVLLGGADHYGARGDMWAYAGDDWTELTPPQLPTGHWRGAGLVYDLARERLVLHGGGMDNSTWEFDGERWDRVDTALAPSVRLHHGMVYDRARSRVLLYGGTDWTTYYSDTWEYVGADRPAMPTVGPPQHLQADPGQEGILLRWEPSLTPGVDGYLVYRQAQDESTFYRLVATPTQALSFRDTAVFSESTYTYYASAVRGVVESAPSSPVAAEAGRLHLAIPTVYAAAGITVPVQVRLGNAGGLCIAAMDIGIRYDPAVAAAVGVTHTALTHGYDFLHTLRDPGEVHVSALGNCHELYGAGALFWIDFALRPTATVSSTLDFVRGLTGTVLYDQDDLYHPVPLELADGRLALSGGGYTLGDLNGDGGVNTADVVLALQIAVGLVDPTLGQRASGDVNGDRSISAADATMILYYAVHQQWPPVSPPGGVQAGPGDTVWVRPQDVAGTVGAEVEVPLVASDGEGIAGSTLVVHYGAGLDYRDTWIGPAFSQVEVHHQPARRRLQVGLAGSGELGGGEQPLAGLEFRLISSTATWVEVGGAWLNDLAGRDFATSAWQRPVVGGRGEVQVKAPFQIYLPLVGRE